MTAAANVEGEAQNVTDSKIRLEFFTIDMLGFALDIFGCCQS